MYQTGSATSSTDLLTKLEAFMASNGWTTDSFATEGTGKRLHAHKGTVYFNARAYSSEIPNSAIAGVLGAGGVSSLAFNIGTGYSGASAWYAQAGAPVGSSGKNMTAGINNLTSTIPAYHFFAQNSGASILVVVEYSAGFYQFLGFGSLNKFGTYTGGEYMFGSLQGVLNDVVVSGGSMPLVGFFSPFNANAVSPSFVTASVDSETGYHWNHVYSTERNSARRWVYDNMERFQSTLGISPNTMNSVAVLTPVVASIERGTTTHGSELRSPIGELPNVYFINVHNLTPGQQITLGSTDYRVFPFFHKLGSATDISSLGTGHSANFGFAVKE